MRAVTRSPNHTPRIVIRSQTLRQPRSEPTDFRPHLLLWANSTRLRRIPPRASHHRPLALDGLFLVVDRGRRYRTHVVPKETREKIRGIHIKTQHVYELTHVHMDRLQHSIDNWNHPNASLTYCSRPKRSSSTPLRSCGLYANPSKYGGLSYYHLPPVS